MKKEVTILEVEFIIDAHLTIKVLPNILTRSSPKGGITIKGYKNWKVAAVFQPECHYTFGTEDEPSEEVEILLASTTNIINSFIAYPLAVENALVLSQESRNKHDHLFDSAIATDNIST